jgi:hypothetical protein
MDRYVQSGNSNEFWVDAAGQLNSMLERLEIRETGAFCLFRRRPVAYERKVSNAFTPGTDTQLPWNLTSKCKWVTIQRVSSFSWEARS